MWHLWILLFKTHLFWLLEMPLKQMQGLTAQLLCATLLFLLHLFVREVRHRIPAGLLNLRMSECRCLGDLSKDLIIFVSCSCCRDGLASVGDNHRNFIVLFVFHVSDQKLFLDAVHIPPGTTCCCIAVHAHMWNFAGECCCTFYVVTLSVRQPWAQKSGSGWCVDFAIII